MSGPPRNPWRRALLREIKAGRLKMSTAAQMAGVSRVRVLQWCREAGIDARKARDRYLAEFYARELLQMTKAGVSPVIAPLIKRRSRPRKINKAQLRAMADQAVIDFTARKKALRRRG